MPARPLSLRTPGGSASLDIGSRSLLSPAAYDDDAASINSRSDQDTDSEDDELQLRARNSRELRAHDRIVLMQEEELDRLVTEQRRRLALRSPFDKIDQILGRRNSSSSVTVVNANAEEDGSAAADETRQGGQGGGRNNKRSKKRRRRRRREMMEDAQDGEDGALMYEMEEGGVKDLGSSTGEDSSMDGNDDDDDDKDSRGKGRGGGGGWKRWVFIWALVTLGFAILVLAAWKVTNTKAHSKPSSSSRPQASPRLVSNGTALFAPTTIIISLDGFRADFLQRGLTPRLNALVAEGVSPKYMLPSFPSVTFPNHWTLATGLYPEAHGVVGNSFWDPESKAEFYYTDPERSRDARWWGGEPFWATAERQGARTAIHMWPGSEARVRAHHKPPSIGDKYNGHEPLENKVSRILGLLDMPGPKEEEEESSGNEDQQRPQLIAAYVPNVDADGHQYGPNSTEIQTTIRAVDNMLDLLMSGLALRNLTSIVNLIVVSDHGMATTDTTRLLQLEDLVDVTKISHIDGWPLYGLRPRNPSDLQPLYASLKEKEKAATSAGAFEVYLRDGDMPARWHFSRNERIAPLWIVPRTGWAIVRKEEFVVEEARRKGLVYHPRGLHGYDHEHPLMRAIFVARGPAFPHPGNSQVEVFQNIEVYNMVCDSLGIVPAPNNGTLRLPLKTVGQHLDWPEIPADPETATSKGIEATALSTVQQTETVVTATSGATATSEASKATSQASTATSQADKTAAPTASSTPSTGSEGSFGDKVKDVWSWVKDEFGKAWGKVTGQA